MRTPRDVGGLELARALRRLGYEIVRQRGSHMRVFTQVNGVHRETIPRQRHLSVGLLTGLIKSIAAHHGMTDDELLDLLDL